jgi:hypothetical protein
VLTRDLLQGRSGGRTAPLSSAEVQPLCNVLRALPSGERAALEARRDGWLAAATKAGNLTAPARDAIEEASAGETGHDRERRTGRVAELIRHPPSAGDQYGWVGQLRTLLGECPDEERREIAAALRAKFFDAQENCTWQLSPEAQHGLYQALRAATAVADT